MPDSLTVVLDIGKTLTKASLWNAAGMPLARESRPNVRADAGAAAPGAAARAYAALDVQGIEAWLEAVLGDFARRGRVRAIIPVAHGAALAILRDGGLACPPMDYESAVPEEVREPYLAQRDAFAQTGSPLLPAALNLGLQLAWLEELLPGLLAPGACIVTWPQYWAWRLSGIAACEVSSLGCHSDLWWPLQSRPSDLARRRGWAQRLAPLREARDVLGKISPWWVRRTGLPADTDIHCGLHDSNAALLAARAFPDMAGRESTVLSTGTWFIALRTAGAGESLDGLPEHRDCLLNVDVYGRPTPSARFMGGREAELMLTGNASRLDAAKDQQALLQAAWPVLASGARALPGFVPQVGPFPAASGRWTGEPADVLQRAAVVSLYLALMADTSLSLIGARERILVEGRFAACELFVRALAALRPRDQVYVCPPQDRIDASFGALRLVHPGLQPRTQLQPVAPLDADLSGYAAQWRRDAHSVATAT